MQFAFPQELGGPQRNGGPVLVPAMEPITERLTVGPNIVNSMEPLCRERPRNSRSSKADPGDHSTIALAIISAFGTAAGLVAMGCWHSSPL